MNILEIKEQTMIAAKVIADSISELGYRITTLELEYPRFIHAEFMTHRQFSRNASSSRAIPINKMIEQVTTNHAEPVHWGLNQAGMQATDEQANTTFTINAWIDARNDAIKHAKKLQDLGLHKQIVNRVLEPYQMIKVLVTATNFDNFFALRLHKDAQPEIQELARVMYDAIHTSVPVLLRYGEWHTPYHGNGYWTKDSTDSLETALKISCSCAAQVSYRKLDDSLEKALAIYDKLVTSEPVHASAFEHCATPLSRETQDGVTHIRIDGIPCSGNFERWVQYRQLIKNHECREFKNDKA